MRRFIHWLAWRWRVQKAAHVLWDAERRYKVNPCPGAFREIQRARYRLRTEQQSRGWRIG